MVGAQGRGESGIAVLPLKLVQSIENGIWIRLLVFVSRDMDEGIE